MPGGKGVCSTFNNWHIFRKVYNPDLSDEEYEIYTDEQSRVEMLKRWRNIAVIIVIYISCASINPIISLLEGAYNPISSISLAAIYLLLVFIWVNAFIGINNLILGKQNKYSFPISVFLMVIFALFVIFILSSLLIGNYNIWFAIGALAGISLVVLVFIISALVSNKNKSN